MIFLLVFAASHASAQTPRPDLPTFGTTVYLATGLRGEIFELPRDTSVLPDFDKLKPMGAIWTNSLNVTRRSFTEGFPGVTSRNEWFAIDYKGRIYVDKPGLYKFELLSDDGSRLYIDDRLIIDNDGLHGPESRQADIQISGGFHRIRLQYFQGPRYEVALVLNVARPGRRARVFNMNDFKPPSNPAKWKYGSPDDLNR